MKAAEALVQILVKEGITDAFGIPGAGINPVYKYLDGAPIAHYCMRHEEACTHAADAYYRASHKIALAICTAGPGATNFATGLYTANIDSIPFLAITGQANTWQLDKDPFQCVNIAEICKTITKKAYCVTDAAELPVEKPCATDAEIAEVVKMLSEAKAPILIMGGGVTLSESESALIDVAEALNVPIIQTYMAKGGVPLAHRLNAGHMGIQVGQPLGNRMFLDSDLVLAVGCRFSDRHTGGIAVYRGERKFIHVDIERTQIGKVFQPDLGVVSDAGLFLKKLLGALKAAEFKPFPDARIEAMNAMRASMERKTDYDDCPIMPHRVFHEVNRGFDSDTMFTAGCGITQIWGGQLQKIDKPMRYLPSGGAGTLGYEIPAAFGAKVAHPERTSVTVVGDFGFTFLGEEIAVSAVYGKPIIVVILNNAYLGLIRQNQKGAYGFEYAVDMPYNQDGRIDYVKVAEGFGCLAERVFTPDDLRSAIQRAKASGRTYVIDAVCVQKQLCDMGNTIDAIKSFAP